MRIWPSPARPWPRTPGRGSDRGRGKGLDQACQVEAELAQHVDANGTEWNVEAHISVGWG